MRMHEFLRQVMTIEQFQTWLSTRQIRLSKTTLRDLCLNAASQRDAAAVPCLLLEDRLPIMAFASILDVAKVGTEERGVWLISKKSAEHFAAAYTLLKAQPARGNA